MILSLLIWQKKAEENNDIKFLIAGNSLKRKAEEKSAHLDILKKRKVELISETKSFPKQHSISYVRDKQITNQKTYTQIE